MNKLLPWLISVVLAVVVGAVSYHYNGVVMAKDAELEAANIHYKEVLAAKDAEIQAVNEKNSSFVAQANTRIKAADDQVGASNEKLKQLAIEARTKIQEIAADANEKIRVANQPEPTVLVTFRKALLGSGGVARIKNSSPQPISIALIAERVSTNQRKGFELIIDGGVFKEIGEREGWAFLSGDTLKVSQPNHKSLSFPVR
jgi:hypothetical protein